MIIRCALGSKGIGILDHVTNVCTVDPGPSLPYPKFCYRRRLTFTHVSRRLAAVGGKGVAEKMFKALLQLRQACCHPCIGSGGISSGGGGGGGGGGRSRLGSGGGLAGEQVGQGRWLTMDQILDRRVPWEGGGCLYMLGDNRQMQTRS